MIQNNKHSNSLWKEAFLRLKSNKIILTCFFSLIFIVILCIFGGVYTSLNPSINNIDSDYGAQLPKLAKGNLFGTDELGRNLFFRCLAGGCVSLSVGVTATFFALFIGVSYGALAGFLGGWKDALMMRIVDVLYALPLLVFIILVGTVTKSPIETFVRWVDFKFLGFEFKLVKYENIIQVLVLFALIGAINWLTMARIVRSQVMNIKNSQYIESARISGINMFRILFKHVLPNVMGPIIVYTTLTIPSVILTESTLSFLGLGVQPPLSSWGALIKDGADKMDVYPWLLFFPSFLLFVTLFSLNFIGDGLRDALDPRTSKI